MSPRTANGSPVIVTLPPEIDAANADQAYIKLCTAVASGAAVVIADLTATAFCDSSSMRRMIMVHNRAAAAGTQLRLAVSPGGPMARVLELLGVGQLLEIYASTHDAVAGPNALK